MENFSLYELIVTLLAGGLALFKFGEWVVKKKIDVIADKTAVILERVADGLDGVAVIARGAGLDKIATIVEEFADVPDEAGDVAAMIAEMTANDDFTKEAVLALLNEGKDVGVEGKDVWVKVIKKKPTE